MIVGQLQLNPISKKLNKPFLRKRPSNLKLQLNVKKSIYSKQEKTKNKIEISQRYLQIPVQNMSKCKSLKKSSGQKSVDRELIRKKSQLISLQIRYLDLHEKFTNLLQKTQNKSFSIENYFQEISFISQSQQKRVSRLTQIKHQLQKINFTKIIPLVQYKNQRRSKSIE